MKKPTFRPLILAVIGLSASLSLMAQTSQPSLAANRILAPIDESRLVSLRGNVAPLAQPRFDRGVAPPATPTGRIMLVLERSAAQQQALTRYLADLQNPSSPSFHKWLTPAQYGASFGLSDSDLQTVESWLSAHGFKIENVPPARNVIQFSGTFDQVQSAFHTSIHTYVVNGATHFANATEPSIPAALAPVVAGVTPLNDFRPRPASHQGPKGYYDPSSQTFRPELTSGGYLYVTPSDAATIYDSPNPLNANFSSGTAYDGSGVSIGIAGDSNINMPDIQNYRTGLLGETTSVNLPTVVIDGNDPGTNGDEMEALLDNEVAGGLAPKAKVYFYTSAGQDIASGLFNSILRAINDNTVSILNISFGLCEATAGTTGNQYIGELAAQAAAQGITITVSSGDSGAAGCDDNNTETTATQGFGVNALASSPYTIAVGGTDYDVLSTDFSSYVSTTSGTAPYYRTASKYIPENPWNNSTSVNGALANNQAALTNNATNIVAAGGGVSTAYPKPAFQIGVTPSDGARDLPDVSLLAANGVYMVSWLVCADSEASGQTTTPSQVDCAVDSSGQFTSSTTITGIGGTSAAAPAFAGMLALVEQAQGGARLGQADFILYQLASSKYSSVFHDVTTGNISVVCTSGTANCGANGFLTGYDAGAQYDRASGLGSVDVAQMISNWNSVSLTSTTTSLDIGGSKTGVTGVHGQSLVFNVAVDPTTTTGAATLITTSGANLPAGPYSVNPFAISIAKGVGSATYNGLPGGTYTVAANYTGDATDAASTSNSINVSISPEDSTTTVTIGAYSAVDASTLSTTNIPYGSEIVADARITGTAEGNNTEGLATGSVVFKDGTATVGTGAVGAGNMASFPPLSSAFTIFPVGTHSITAVYSGDASYNPNTSTTPATFTVAKAATTAVATATPASLSAGATSTVSVTVTSPYNYGVAPTGSVSLALGGTTLGTAGGLAGTMLSTGTWSLKGSVNVSASQLAAGTNTLTVAYSGDANYAASTTAVSITLGTATGPAIALTNSGSITVAPGATTGNTSTISVSPSGGFTGAVNLSCVVSTTLSATSAPTCALNPNPVTISGTTAANSVLTVTTQSATTEAVYTVLVTGADAATGKITATTSVTVTVTSQTANPAISLTNSGGITVVPGASTGNTSTISVSPSGGFTGAVNLSCAVTTAITNPTAPPTCALSSQAVTISGTGAATATLTVTTTAATRGALHLPLKRFFLTGGGTALAMILFFGIPARRRAWRSLLGLMVLAIVVSATGCGSSGGSSGGGGSSSGTTAGAYTVTVTGTDAATGKITARTAVSLTVN